VNPEQPDPEIGPNGTQVATPLIRGGAVLLSSAVLWMAREQALVTGLPCDARGIWGCRIDGPIYFVVGAASAR